MLADDAGLNRDLESCLKKNDRSKFPEKWEQTIPGEISHVIKNSKTLFSKLMQKIS